MLRSLFRRRVLVLAALALAAAGPAYAFINFLPGFVWPAAVPTPAAGYLMPVTISPGLYRDNIAGIEVGRDDRSPFVAITVLFDGTAANPTPNPVIAALGPYLPNFPNFPSQAPYPAPPANMYYLRLVYRPINDPANPGWGPPLPGAAGQLDAAMQTCLDLAAELTTFRTAAQTGAGLPIPPANPASPPAQIYLEFDPVQAVTLLEFYKLEVIR